MTLCFVRALSARPQRSYTSITVKFTCAFAVFCVIVRSNIVFIWCISALSLIECVWLINRALIEYSLPVIIFSSAHAAQTAAHN